MVNTYSGMLFSFLKRNPIICDNIDEHLGHYTNYNQPATEEQILNDFIYTRYLK